MVAGLAKQAIAYLSEKDPTKYKLSCDNSHAKKLNVGTEVKWRPSHQYCQNPNQTITLNVISSPQQTSGGQSSFYCTPQAANPLQLHTNNEEYITASNYHIAKGSKPEFARFIDGSIAEETYKANNEWTLSGYGDVGQKLIDTNAKAITIGDKIFTLSKVTSSVKDNCKQWRIILTA